MSKRLNPYTIIPQDLYVERAADRQVQKILEGMGRPGYVLVARQMGKTNLLLNAKRKFSSGRDLFVYLDLSNTFPDVRSFFRNVVDSIIEAAPEDVRALKSEIDGVRLSRVSAPHKEHEWELRTIIQLLAGRLVVCLDEIDALTKVEYSDQVFSFIRSVYFSGRANFPELSSLTYLLSGVAEPSEIIKNRDISPFNIGEKIVLDDFSLPEFDALLSKANLQLSSDVLDHVYSWTSGHPRMTWDLCSNIEDASAAGVVDVAKVDQLVSEIYFGELGFPPVDQIKKQAQESKDIRDALISIHYGRGDAISDTIRTRLYLIGVSRLAPQGRAVEFKNRVFEEALSEDFLRSIRDEGAVDAISVAQEYLSAHKYEEAIQCIEGYLRTEPNEPERTAYAKYLLGTAHFALRDYSASEVYLADALPHVADDSRAMAKFLLATAHFRVGKFREAYESLREAAIEGAPKLSPAFVASATVDWCYCVSRLELRDDMQHASNACKRLISQPSVLLAQLGGLQPSGLTLAAAYDALAELATRQKDAMAAREWLAEGLEFAVGDLQVKMLLAQATVERSKRAFNLAKCQSLIGACKSFSVDPFDDPSTITLERAYDVMEALEAVGQGNEAAVLVNHILEASVSTTGVIEVINQTLARSVAAGASALGMTVLENALQKYGHSLAPRDRHELLYTLCALSKQQAAKHAKQYLELFSEPSLTRPNVQHSVLLHNLVVWAVEWSNRPLADLAMEVLSREPVGYESLTVSQRESFEVLRMYSGAFKDLSFSPAQGEIAKARAALLRISEMKNFIFGNLPSAYVRTLQASLTALLRRHGSLPTVNRGRKLGRNDIVTVSYDGDLRTGKYKRFIADLESGICVLT